MRVVLQRVTQASVKVDGEVIGCLLYTSDAADDA